MLPLQDKKHVTRRRWQKRNRQQLMKESKAYYASHRVKFTEYRRKKTPEQKRAEKLRHRYNITIRDYERMLTKQKEVCFICHKKNRAKRLFVDHCHRTGKVRGLLCSTCNFFMQRVDTDHNTVRRLEAYIATTSA